MKLHKAVTQYITYRKSLGDNFTHNEWCLKAFVRYIGQNKNLSSIQVKQVDAFLAGKSTITAHWHNKHNALNGFYRYLISRGYSTKSPLPVVITKRPRNFKPYIYNIKELSALLDAALTYQTAYQSKRSLLDPYMLHTILLLLYGSGLRISEAINLKIADVDFPQALLTIRGTKFYKTRLVPLGSKLIQSLSKYARQRQQDGHSINPESPFFVKRNGKPNDRCTFDKTFRIICNNAGVRRTDNSRYQPRLHDLRHTFAVRRLIAWYKEGADVQKWLPILSVYLGHASVSSTSVYLTMTPVLLEEAGRRFEHYAFKEVSND